MTPSELFAKYDLPMPRYTSYPTVPQWHRTPTAAEWTRSLAVAAATPDSSMSLYVHIPFCESLCTFCGCNTVITRDHGREDAYVDLLLSELDTYLAAVPALSSMPLRQFHLGGGTPTFLSAAALGQLTDGVLARLPARADDFEGSVEVDPRVTNEAQLDTLRRRGFSRLSLGVQDLDPNVQHLVNRTQPLSLTSTLTAVARTLGYESINYDLIYGLPGQTPASMARLVADVLRLAPDRLAVYSFARVPWIKPAQRRFHDDQIPAGADKRALYDVVRSALLHTDYVEIGMDHFARPHDALARAAGAGRLHRNFMGYTDVRTTTLLGVGVSAISETTDCYHQNDKVISVYERRVQAHEIPTLRGHVLSEEDRRRRDKIAALMTSFAVRLDDSELAQAPTALQSMVADGLVVLEGCALVVRTEGRPFLRNAASFFDEYLGQSAAAGTRVLDVGLMTHARVVGAGLSGLAAAWHLAEAGYAVEVIDASATPGGLIETVRTPYGPVERAANAFAWTVTTARWFDRLGITPLSPSRASRRRFIFARGAPRQWPLGPAATSAMAGRALTAWLARWLRPIESESVADWSDRVCGPRATASLVGPALYGVYAVSPAQLSARLILGRAKAARPKGDRRRLVAPASGMGEFIERLVRQLTDRGVTFALNTRLDAIDAFTPTVIATDAASASALIRPHAPSLSAAIGAIGATSLLTATAFFRPSERDLHGFGVLFPRDSGADALGVLFNTDIFAERGTFRSETWIYALDDQATLSSDSEVRRAMERDRELLTRRREEPVAMYVTRRSPAIPIYGTGILEISRRLTELPPWLSLAGNYLGRLGVAALLDVADEAVARLGPATSSRSVRG